MIPADSERIDSIATLTRVAVSDGEEDTLLADSLGHTVQKGNSAFERCGVGLAGPPSNLSTHRAWPARINLKEWVTRECFLEGVNQLSGKAILAKGNISLASGTGDETFVEIEPGDNQALIDAIRYANLQPKDKVTVFRWRKGGEHVFNDDYNNSGNAVPVLRRNVRFENLGRDPVVFSRGNAAGELFRFMEVVDCKVTSRDPEDDLDIEFVVTGFGNETGGGGLLVRGNGDVALEDWSIRFCFSDGNGAGVLVQGNAEVTLEGCGISFNESRMNGGATAVTGSAKLTLNSCYSQDNKAAKRGGAYYRGGQSSLVIKGGVAAANEAESGGTLAVSGTGERPGDGPAVKVTELITGLGVTSKGGCDLHIDVDDGGAEAPSVLVERNQFGGDCTQSRIRHDQGNLLLVSNFTNHPGGGPVIEGAFEDGFLLGNILQIGSPQSLDAHNPGTRPEAVCEGSGINSLGHNISSDESCGPG